MVHVFPPLPVADVPVRGTLSRYAVRRIFCVGRNYADHAREMGGDPNREPPFYFTKSPDSIHLAGGDLRYPPATQNLHHEMELVVALGADVHAVASARALDAVFGYAAGLDMTRRDLQNAAKDKGRPWDLGKSFEQSAVIGEIVPATVCGHLAAGTITLAVNGAVKQSGDLADMIWTVPEIVAHLSAYYHLGPGDLIYTGTPAGVGPVVPGDRMTGAIAGLGEITVTVV